MTENAYFTLEIPIEKAPDVFRQYCISLSNYYDTDEILEMKNNIINISNNKMFDVENMLISMEENCSYGNVLYTLIEIFPQLKKFNKINIIYSYILYNSNFKIIIESIIFNKIDSLKDEILKKFNQWCNFNDNTVYIQSKSVIFISVIKDMFKEFNDIYGITESDVYSLLQNKITFDDTSPRSYILQEYEKKLQNNKK